MSLNKYYFNESFENQCPYRHNESSYWAQNPSIYLYIWQRSYSSFISDKAEY